MHCRWLALFGLAVAGCAQVSFDAARLRGHVAYLADDARAGRAVGGEGIEAAAGYIAEKFKAAGLAPAGDGGSYFQPFEVTLSQQLAGRPRLSVRGAPAWGVLWRDYVTLPFSSREPFEGALAFAGYGISHPDVGYDDYADFDATGKVLLMFRYEPHDEDPEAAFGGLRPSVHAHFEAKARLAREHGAAAVLIVNPPEHHGEADRLFKFDPGGEVVSFGIPMMHVSRAMAGRLLAAAGADDLRTLQQALDTRRASRSMDLRGLVARGDPGLVRQRAETRNVVGVARGSGRLAEEYLVIGAHYDHLGVAVPRRGHRAAAPEGVRAEIHNGADDNASGTAALIELARAFAARRGARRSVLFIAFSAEEIGLLGSDHFVDHPTVPIDRVAAMLNLDMVGRLRENRLQVHGIKTGAEFEPLVSGEARALGFDLKTSGGGFGPSDHTSFYKKQIPVLHFFTGVHGDYHLPTDDTELINEQGMMRVTELVYQVADALARSSARPTYVAVAEKAPGGPVQLKVRMGVMPSYVDDDEPGMLIDGVSPASPAERAGLADGDRVLYIAERSINNVYDLMDALGRQEPGDTAVVTVLRAGERVKLPITFEAR